MPTIHSEGFFARFEDQFRPFIADLGIPDTVFSQPDVEISTDLYAELLDVVGREVNPHIGLDMGAAMEISDLGVVGHALAATPDIGTLLSVFSKYLYVFSQSNTLRLDVGDRRAAITYQATVLTTDIVAQDVECALAFATSIIRDLSGRDFKPRKVEFEHQQPESTRVHRQYFGCDILFNRPANRVHFDREVLRWPVKTSDPGLLEALRFFLDDRLKIRTEEGNLEAKLRHLIASSLAHGVPDQKRIATELGISARTLQRRLNEMNLVFADLVDQIRLSIAQDYVLHSEFNLTEISLMLGYGELSSFSRAYKRWTGLSPEAARKSMAKKVEAD